MRKLFSISLLVLILFSCKKQNEKSNENKYKIVSIIYQKITKPNNIKYPPPPPEENRILNYNDSLKIDATNNEIRKKNLIIAVKSNFTEFDYNVDVKKCSQINTLVNLNKNINNISEKVKLNMINKIKSDSLIYFKDSLLEKNSKDFYKFDQLIEFSQVIFNKNFTKSAIKVTVYDSKIAGASMIYYLEKNNEKWNVICEEGLIIF